MTVVPFFFFLIFIRTLKWYCSRQGVGTEIIKAGNWWWQKPVRCISLREYFLPCYCKWEGISKKTKQRHICLGGNIFLQPKERLRNQTFLERRKNHTQTLVLIWCMVLGWPVIFSCSIIHSEKNLKVSYTNLEGFKTEDKYPQNKTKEPKTAKQPKMI